MDAASENYPDSEHTLESRRRFLPKLAALVLGAVCTIAPLAAGVRVWLDPVLRRRKGERSFLRVASLDSLPADGAPRLFRIVTDHRDAWTTHRQVPIGAVYLVRDANDPERITAFNTVCPHLGCFVDAQPDRGFLCPCHNSRFAPDGSRGSPCVAARGLDELETTVEDGQVLVHFQNFLTGKAEKIPV